MNENIKNDIEKDLLKDKIRKAISKEEQKEIYKDFWKKGINYLKEKGIETNKELLEEAFIEELLDKIISS